MPLDNTTIVDAVGIEAATGCVVLTITDSWEWIDEKEHLLALQAKLNAYFEFIESGQIWDSYPTAHGKPLVIDVVCRFPLTPAGIGLLQRASDVASQLDVTIRHRHYQGESPT